MSLNSILGSPEGSSTMSSASGSASGVLTQMQSYPPFSQASRVPPRKSSVGLSALPI